MNSATVAISVDVQNLTLNGSAIGQSSVPGEGHYHIYLDNVWLRAEVALDTFLAGVTSGAHNLRVELAENNHTELGYGDQANFTVQPAAPRLVILSPGNSSAWPSNSVELHLRVENFTLNAGAIGGAAVAGEGHYLLTVDGAEVAEAAGLWYNVTRLSGGPAHVIRVELVGNDGASLAVPTYDQISIRLGAGAPWLLLNVPLSNVSIDAASLPVDFFVANFTLDGAAILQPPSPGRGHYIAWLDGVSLGPGVDNPLLLTDLAQGTHSLWVELVNNDNTPLTARVVDGGTFTVAPGAARVTITSPADPTTINASSVRVDFEVANFSLSAAHIGQTNVAGEGHWHVFVDGNDAGEGTSAEALVSDLTTGPHVVTIELLNNDRTPLVWPTFDAVRIVVQPSAPRITITSPATTTVTVASSSVELTIQVQNFQLNASQIGLAPRAGQGHWHLFVDGVYRGFGTSLNPLAAQMTPGTHSVVVELFNNNHSPLLWPAFDQIAVVVPDGSPTLSILSPTTGANLPLNFTALKVGVANFSVVDKRDQAPVAGEGHWHIFLDGAFYGMAYTPTFLLLDLAPGQHTARAVLVGNNHVFVSPLVADEVSFSVQGLRASIHITAPNDGGILYGDSTTLSVNIVNFTVQPGKVGQPPVLGEGHWHFLLDNQYVTYVTNLSYPVVGLAPGDHTLTARLYNNDHSPLDFRIESVVTLHVAGAPHIVVTSPANGLVTSDRSVEITVATTNFTLDPLSMGTANQLSHGHYHVYIDENLSTMESDLSATVSNLSIGVHFIRIVLVNRDHSPIGAPGSEALLVVTVVEAAGGEGINNGLLVIVIGLIGAIAGAAVATALLLRRRKPDA